MWIISYQNHLKWNIHLFIHWFTSSLSPVCTLMLLYSADMILQKCRCYSCNFLIKPIMIQDQIQTPWHIIVGSSFSNAIQADSSLHCTQLYFLSVDPHVSCPIYAVTHLDYSSFFKNQYRCHYLCSDVSMQNSCPWDNNGLSFPIRVKEGLNVERHWDGCLLFFFSIGILLIYNIVVLISAVQ